MKVLLAHNYYRTTSPSGEDAVFQNEMQLLADNNIDVVPFERHSDDIDDSSLSKRLALSLSVAWSRTSYSAIDRLIRKTRPDIAHFHNTFPLISPSAYAACRDNNVPVIQTLHNFRLICPGALLLRDGQPCESCVGSSLLPALRYRCYRNSLAATGSLVCMLKYNRMRGSYASLVNRYIALTRFAAERLQAGGLPADRMVVKPNFLPGAQEPGKGAGGYVVFTGRLSVEKGVHTLLEAWKLLKGVPLKILGDGPLLQELQEMAHQGDLPIEFLGHRPKAEILEIVGDAAFAVVPSEWYEGFPMVILEAYARGTPVLASRIGSLDEIVIDGLTGTKFTAGDSRGLADKVHALFNSPERLHALRATTRQHFYKHFTGKANLQQLLKIYHDTIADT